MLSCDVAPEALHYGKDGCYTCKMTLMDKKFGAELVTRKGKIYKFDDVNCMMDFYNSNNEPKENMAYLLVVDFSKPEKLINAKQAFYCKSEMIKTPMASQVAAFEKREDFEKHNKTWNGEVLNWEELVSMLKSHNYNH